MVKQNKELKQKAKLWFKAAIDRPFQELTHDCTWRVNMLQDKELRKYLLDKGYIYPEQETHINEFTGEVYTVTKYKRRWCISEYFLLFILIGSVLAMFIPMGWALCTL